jgi:hypothetical protein
VERAPDRGTRCPLGRSTSDSEQSDKNEAAEKRNKDTQRFVQQVRSTTRRKYTAEEKIHLVLEGFRREVTVNELCRREGIKPDNFYSWTKGSMEEGKQCILIIIGVTANGIKKFVAIEDGYRESEHSWLMTFRDLKQRGLKIGVELAVGDGASGFWKVLPKSIWTDQLSALLGSQNQKRAQVPAQEPPIQSSLQQIWMAPTREQTHRAFDHLMAMHKAK